jgi:hypothetical protein
MGFIPLFCWMAAAEKVDVNEAVKNRANKMEVRMALHMRLFSL